MAKNKTVRITFESNVPELLAMVGQEGRRKTAAMGTTYRATVVNEVLVGERTGNWRQVPGTSRMYRASRPGEPPAVRTGDLRRSITVGKVEGTGVGSSVKVGSALHYARELEEEMNRKFFGPAFDLARPALENILRADWGVK